MTTLGFTWEPSINCTPTQYQGQGEVRAGLVVGLPLRNQDERSLSFPIHRGITLFGGGKLKNLFQEVVELFDEIPTLHLE